MNENERVKELRKSLGLTMEKFGSSLGVGKTAISKIESGERTLTYQMIKSIAREYNVSEEWLRDGVGERDVVRPIGDEIKSQVDLLLPDESEEFRLRLIRMILAMDKEDLQKLEAYARAYLFPDEESGEPSIREKVASYHAELKAQESSSKYGALPITEENA